MGDHVNTKKVPGKFHKRGFAEGQDIASARKRRVTFKHYVQELEEELLDLELEDLSSDEQDE